MEKKEIGQCRSLKIKCVSEIGWLDPEKLLNQMQKGGGLEKNQWTIPWSYENAAGFCSLIDMETLEGEHHKFLLDTGWNNQYMDKCFKREGIDRMLKDKEIDSLIISHEHLDHFWGLETVLKYNPDIKIIIPNTFFPEGKAFLKGAEFAAANVRNRISHEGELIKIKPKEIKKIYDGCAVAAFDLPIIIRVRGEVSLYFNIKDKGVICVTGCCHQGIISFAEFAKKNIAGAENLYGVYGGLHIAPFGTLTPEGEKVIKEMARYNFKKIACNHCTGIEAVRKMIELGYPIVKGTGRYGSASDLYIGNGDEVIF
ncbi:MAG: MBL fold metallo-hydrolase [Deltaproteobacteria bacterium]|nr:MBL fold metallo-hydrolase [Deltaproteobacteria bacterium]